MASGVFSKSGTAKIVPSINLRHQSRKARVFARPVIWMPVRPRNRKPAPFLADDLFDQRKRDHRAGGTLGMVMILLVELLPGGRGRIVQGLESPEVSSEVRPTAFPTAGSAGLFFNPNG